METSNPTLDELSREDRQLVESWLVDFEQSWNERLLSDQARELPGLGDPLRQPALLELVKIDLERQWRAGHRRTVEEYLEEYRELGNRDTVSVTLLHTEFEVRQQFGAAADVEEFRRRFPRQADELEKLVASIHQSQFSLFRSTSETTGSMSGDVSTERLSPSAHDLPLSFGRYRVMDRLGKGGMGEVFRALDAQLGREVAVKILPRKFVEQPEWLDRFEKEARAVAALSHPNILAIHDFGTDEGIPFAVTELLEGETLRQRISRSPIPWQDALKITIPITEGLSAAHDKGIIHRDLKPENVFLTCDGVVKVLDFGLAKMELSELPRKRAEPIQPAHTGPWMGTAAYMSPEQVRGISADARSDIFALGCVVYEMVTSHRAFPGKTADDTLSTIAEDKPANLSFLNNQVPSEVEQAIRQCLEKKPENRFDSAANVVAALKTILENSEELSARRALSTRRLRSTIAIVLAASLVALFFIVFGKPSTHDAINSIAVLPLTNNSEDAETQSLCDGITENLINRLSQLRGLRVTPRSATFQYQGQSLEGDAAQRIAHELGVRSLVTGRLAKQADTFTVQVELIDVDRQSQLWGDQFTRSLSDILSVQETISRHIVKTLKLPHTDGIEGQLSKRYTNDAEAYQLYLLGRYHINNRRGSDYDSAIQCFHKAIARDPNYALAYCGLADSYNVLGIYGAILSREAGDMGREAAETALEKDDKLAEAHTSLGAILSQYEWDWELAETYLERALDLNPRHGAAHRWYAGHLAKLGRFDEAIRESNRAIELEPLSLIAHSNMGFVLYLARRYDASIDILQRTLEMEPNFASARKHLCLAYLGRGHYDKAIADFRGRPGFEPLIAHAHAMRGDVAEARNILGELRDLAKNQHVEAFKFAVIHVGLGENNEAFQWLEKAYEYRTWKMGLLKVIPIFDSLRSDPRFDDLQERIGLSP